MKPVIEVKNLYKKYHIGHVQTNYLVLTEVLGNAFKETLKKIRGQTFNQKRDVFWALRNISFTVAEGEILGIIGPNGAGKSTLLKILSRITPPTKGQAILRGKIASLLEVGTGFHPELSGRENIFLNGAILGMTRFEIKKRFDEIVEFSGVEKFLDTPVKHYSSGMQVRLAFSVAAHLNSEILIVDEVLSVGDASFQKKCLGEIESASKKGRTILFVSHNMSAITALCQKVIFLKSGKIITIGDPARVVGKYLKIGEGVVPIIDCTSKKLKNEVVSLVRIKACDKSGKVLSSFDIRKSIGIIIEYIVLKPNIWFACNIQVKNQVALLLFNSHADMKQDWQNAPQKTGLYKSTCWIPGNFLAEGLFTVRVTLGGFSKKNPTKIDFPDAISFNVHDNLEGDSVRGKSTTDFPGLIRPKLKWERVKIDTPS